MTTTGFPSTVIAVAEPAFTNAERLALAGFLTSYAGQTRDRLRAAYASTPADATTLLSACSMLEGGHRVLRGGLQARACPGPPASLAGSLVIGECRAAGGWSAGY
jgi:hypothetical protein